MSEQPDVRLKGWKPQKLNTSYAKDASWTKGLRDWVEYRDLGIGDATGGQIHAQVIRIKTDGPVHHSTTGLHRHLCDFQMNFCLKGWVKFVYEGHEGEFKFEAGDSWVQPAGIVHNEIEMSEDFQVLEIYSPAVHDTIAVEQMPEAAD